MIAMTRPHPSSVKLGGSCTERDAMKKSLERDRRIRAEAAQSRMRVELHHKDCSSGPHSRRHHSVNQRQRPDFPEIKKALLSDRGKVAASHGRMEKSPPVKTVLNSSHSDCRKDANRVKSSFRTPHSVVLPLSPQSDNSDDIIDDLDKILHQQVTAEATVLEGHSEQTQHPVSPSTLDSPPDSDMSEGETSPHRQQHTRFIFPPVPDRDRDEPTKTMFRPDSQNKNNVLSDDSASDFEDFLNIATTDALRNPNEPNWHDSTESEDELPSIEYSTNETSDVIEDNLDPSVALNKFVKKPVQYEAQEMDHQSTPNLILEASTSEERSSSRGSASSYSDFVSPQPCPEKTTLFRDMNGPPPHVRIKGGRSGSKQSCDGVRFTSHMRNLVEACYDEGFVDSAVSLMQQLTTTETYPPSDLIHFVLESVLLDYSMPQHMTSHAYHVLEFVNGLHPLNSTRVQLNWEWISTIISVLVIEVRSSTKAKTRQSVADVGKLVQERSLQALRFVETVLENDLQHLLEEHSDGAFRPFLLERYMVKDVLDWLDQCISCYRPGAPKGQKLLSEIVRHLQKLIRLSCHRDFGDHVDFISHNMVHKLDDWNLQQKCYFFQSIKAPRFAQKLLEVYLETRYEVPSCPACRDERLKLFPSKRLSVQKIFLHHIHQRPLEGTRGALGEDFFFEDQETGERVHGDVAPLGAGLSQAEGRHCVSCSKRVTMTTEQAEELVLLIMCLLKSFLLCPFSGPQFPGKPFKHEPQVPHRLTDEDRTLLRNVNEYVESFTTDLHISCPKLSMRTKLYLRQMAILGSKES